VVACHVQDPPQHCQIKKKMCKMIICILNTYFLISGCKETLAFNEINLGKLYKIEARSWGIKGKWLDCNNLLRRFFSAKVWNQVLSRVTLFEWIRTLSPPIPEFELRASCRVALFELRLSNECDKDGLGTGISFLNWLVGVSKSYQLPY
jgi:hypothetical protein